MDDFDLTVPLSDCLAISPLHLNDGYNHIPVYSTRVLAEKLHARGKFGCHSSNRPDHARNGRFARSTPDPPRAGSAPIRQHN